MDEALAQSGVSRRLVGRIAAGEDPCAALAALCESNDVRAGEVRATGVLAHVELSEIDAATGAYASVGRLEGPLTLVQAYGNVSKMGDQTLVIMRAVVSWDGGGEHRVAGGHMLSAEALTVEFVVDAFDDISMARRLDPAVGMLILDVSGGDDEFTRPAPMKAQEDAADVTGLAIPRIPVAPEAPGSIPVRPAPIVQESTPTPIATRRPSGWDVVAAKSKELDEPDEDAADAWTEGLDGDLRRGDVLLHPRFGRCKVLRVEEEERVVLVDEARKPRTVALDYLSLRQDPDVEGRVFQVRVGRST